MKDYVCEPLGNQHDRTQFDCGVPVLNDYLAKVAKQDVKRKASARYFCPMPSHVASEWQVKLLQALLLSIPKVKPQRVSMKSSGLSRYRNYLTGCFFQCRRQRNSNPAACTALTRTLACSSNRSIATIRSIEAF